ncbi:hypothetical protein AB0G02_12800 [Actinosynnema sp. NPDC023658]|uniref:hypothetical protein n=1 Tax=Actinosynnema sp. NPDC023658 TaxID=3155465 RepID=UPI0033CBBE26
MQKKCVTIGSLLAVLLATAVVPAATAAREAAAEPPAACAGMVSQLADSVKKVVEPLAAAPPAPDKAATPLADTLVLLVGMTAAKCLPAPPLSKPPAEVRFQGPELCLSHSMAVFAGAFSVLSKIVPGAVAPDPGKLRGEVQGWLKTLNDALQNCGLPAPAGGMPTLPNPPA